MSLTLTQKIAHELGLRAYTPEGHHIIKEKKKLGGTSWQQCRTFVKETGTTIYEARYDLNTHQTIKKPRKYADFEAYQKFNPKYNLIP